MSNLSIQSHLTLVKPTRNDVMRVIPDLRFFIGRNQLAVMADCCRGEEGPWFVQKFIDMHHTITTMPKVYGQDGLGEEAVVHLHYFKSGCDWYITERDTSGAQLQAFGLADLFNDGGELGYISIAELIGCGVEFDLHWQPKTLREVRAYRSTLRR